MQIFWCHVPDFAFRMFVSLSRHFLVYIIAVALHWYTSAYGLEQLAQSGSYIEHWVPLAWDDSY